MKQKYNSEPDLNIDDMENKMITVALARSASRGEAAERLGISLRSLKRKIGLRRAKGEKVT